MILPGKTKWSDQKGKPSIFLGRLAWPTRCIRQAIGSWVFGLVLSFFGYAANVEQTSSSILGIVLSTSWIPCAMMVAAAALMQFYPLTEAMMIKIEADLKQRRGEIEA